MNSKQKMFISLFIFLFFIFPNVFIFANEINFYNAYNGTILKKNTNFNINNLKNNWQNLNFKLNYLSNKDLETVSENEKKKEKIKEDKKQNNEKNDNQFENPFRNIDNSDLKDNWKIENILLTTGIILTVLSFPFIFVGIINLTAPNVDVSENMKIAYYSFIGVGGTFFTAGISFTISASIIMWLNKKK